MGMYIFSGWPQGTYGNEWDMGEAIRRREIWFADYVPLSGRVRSGDQCYLRTYGRGIFAKGDVGPIEYEGSIVKMALHNLQGFVERLSNAHFFLHSSNQNERSRIIRISNQDRNFIEKHDREEERTLKAIIDENDDALSQILGGMHLCDVTRKKNLYGYSN